ncbi:flagellar hook protein FlgE [Pseudaeromonas sharmana]|uniref:Flagellar hook protein FlgE n=1 Tax=Pseudaeromonas sharmana TaxID=328412 RepID=A0ABV8CIX8_9GAMM
MSFNIALSGLNASQKQLDVTANNIANVNTTGFKGSRAEFSDVYSSSVFANAKTVVGNGVQTAAVTQQFHQGALQSTNSALDLAIKGEGFFVTSGALTSQDRTYTRAGAFQINDDGYVTTSQGQYLQVYQVNDDGTPKAVSLDSTQALQIPSVAGKPTATTKVNESLNLPANGTAVDPANFDPTDSDTYTSSTSVVIYDSLGQSHTVTQYFMKDSTATTNPNTWRLVTYVDNQAVDINGGTGTPAGAVLEFDTQGALTSQTPATITTEALGTPGAGVITNGADGTQTFSIDFDTITQYASAFSVSSLSQDGSTVGQLTNVDIGSDGLVAATYSNGTTVNLGMVAMAKFSNPQGLTQIGDTSWKASLASGEAVPSQAGIGTVGSIQSSALEASNTNLSSELVDLITAQRNYQANSRALEVNSTLQQTILQIR